MAWPDTNNDPYYYQREMRRRQEEEYQRQIMMQRMAMATEPMRISKDDPIGEYLSKNADLAKQSASRKKKLLLLEAVK